MPDVLTMVDIAGQSMEAVCHCACGASAELARERGDDVQADRRSTLDSTALCVKIASDGTRTPIAKPQAPGALG